MFCVLLLLIGRFLLPFASARSCFYYSVLAFIVSACLFRVVSFSEFVLF